MGRGSVSKRCAMFFPFVSIFLQDEDFVAYVHLVKS